MGASTAPYLDAHVFPSPKQAPTLQPRLAPPPTWQGPPTWPQPCPCPIQPPQPPWGLILCKAADTFRLLPSPQKDQTSWEGGGLGFLLMKPSALDRGPLRSSLREEGASSLQMV